MKEKVKRLVGQSEYEEIADPPPQTNNYQPQFQYNQTLSNQSTAHHTKQAFGYQSKELSAASNPRFLYQQTSYNKRNLRSTTYYNYKYLLCGDDKKTNFFMHRLSGAHSHNKEGKRISVKYKNVEIINQPNNFHIDLYRWHHTGRTQNWIHSIDAIITIVNAKHRGNLAPVIEKWKEVNLRVNTQLQSRQNPLHILLVYKPQYNTEALKNYRIDGIPISQRFNIIMGMNNQPTVETLKEITKAIHQQKNKSPQQKRSFQM